MCVSKWNRCNFIQYPQYWLNWHNNIFRMGKLTITCVYHVHAVELSFDWHSRVKFPWLSNRIGLFVKSEDHWRAKNMVPRVNWELLSSLPFDKDSGAATLQWISQEGGLWSWDPDWSLDSPLFLPLLDTAARFYGTVK